MFNNTFYPSTPEVIDQLIEGLELRGKKAYDPQGGSGKIVERLLLEGAEVISSEKDPDLRKILQTKCVIIGEDCLKITSDQISHIDFIIMNPPFYNAQEHILHMWKIAPAGCKIRSLCNIETLENAYSKSREELKTLVDTYGNYTDIGDAFAKAERKTSVKVGLVRLEKPGANYNQEFEGFFMDEDPAEDQVNGLMSYNAVRDLVNRYVESIKIYDQQLETAVRLNDMAKDYFHSGKQNLSISVTRGSVPVCRNDFKKDMQRDGWNWIFNQMDLTKHTTRGLREDINKFVETQQNVPFTMKNIYRMLEIVIATTGQRMDKAIIEVFDRVTAHHADNRYNIEGWKTNSHYLLTKRFIIPNMAAVDKWHTGNKLTNCYGSYFNLMEDVMKALCYVTATPFEELESLESVCRKDSAEYGVWFEWSFFKVKAHKKGTMHFEFLNEDVWAKFNQRIAKIKGYPLPEKKEQTPFQQRQNGHTQTKTAHKPTAQKPVVLSTFQI